MKTKIISISIFLATAVIVGLFPAIEKAIAKSSQSPSIIKPVEIEPTQNNASNENKRPAIEVVFVLDTTGSMSGLIDAAKEKIWSIASTMASAQTAPYIKMGLVAYRDRGDAYVTRKVELSDDLDSMYAQLMDFQADGGGDFPESVNEGLFVAVNNMSWNQQQETYKVIFLVGDAPAHMDYQDDVKYPQILKLAEQKGIIVNTIQAGFSNDTTENWKKLAALGNGNYFQVAQNGNAVAISTPYDKEMVKLSAEMDKTRLYYGDHLKKAKQALKLKSIDKLKNKATDEALARRATFNSLKAGKTNFLGEGELVDAISSGDVSLAEISHEELPETLQALSPPEQKAVITQAKQKREEIQRKISEISKKRSAYLKNEVAKLGGQKDSFDARIFGTIRSQAKEKGIIYDDDSAKY